MHVRDLKQARSNGQIASFDLQNVFSPNVEVIYARLMESGDIVTSTLLWVLDELSTSDVQSVDDIPKHHLMRLSQNGSTIWRVEIERSNGLTYALCDTATTFNNRHYGFEPVMDTDLIDSDRIAFTIRSLEDGHIVMQRELAMAAVQRVISRDFSNSLQLDIATDETFLMLRTHKHDMALIINATDGDCISFCHSAPRIGLSAAGAPSICAAKYEPCDYTAIRHFTFNSATKGQRFTDRRIILQKSHGLRPGVDMDRSLVFRLVHSDACQTHDDDTVDPWTTVVVADIKEETYYNDPAQEPKHVFVEQKKKKVVTLPSDQEQGHVTESDRRSNKKIKSEEPEICRRLLEFAAGWKQPPNDFIGMSNDYLIYHAAEDDTLLVLNFWPQW